MQNFLSVIMALSTFSVLLASDFSIIDKTENHQTKQEWEKYVEGTYFDKEQVV